jgi:hypothetical protein
MKMMIYIIYIIIFIQFLLESAQFSIIASSVHNIVQDVIDEDTRQRRMRTWMRFPMTDQSRLLSKGFAADIAHVWPDTGVDE